MASLHTNFLGIHSPNPYWLASAPPTDKAYNVLRAFEAGWGGVVWKTLGTQVKNVSSRYSSVDYGGQRVMGFNNIELISDRPLRYQPERNQRSSKRVSRPGNDCFLMADNDKQSWHELIKKVEDTGAHGLELNFGCPHGMTERGMGAAVGQDPEIARMVVEWVMEVATIPVITKLTPNVHSVVPTGKAVRRSRNQRTIAHQHHTICYRCRPRYPRSQPHTLADKAFSAAIADPPLNPLHSSSSPP